MSPSTMMRMAGISCKREILQVIRTALPHNTVILTGTNWSSLDGLLKIKPVSDANVVYTFHSYEPALLTLLGFWDPSIDQSELAANIPFPVAPTRSATAPPRPSGMITRVRLYNYWCSETHNDDTIAA